MTHSPPAPEPGASKTSPFALRLVLVAVLLAGFFAFFALDLDRYVSFETLRQNRESWQAFVEANTILSALLAVGIYAVVVAFSLPGATLMTLAVGFLFGTVAGGSIVVVGATLGATIVFLVARTALGEYLRAKAGPALRKMEDGFARNALSYLLVLRLVPLFPFWLVNLVPAFLGVSTRAFVIATFFGIMPGSFVYASVGAGLGSVFDAGRTPDLGIIFEPQVLLPLVGLAALALVPVIYKRVRKDTGGAV